jgi:hypothetical protein
MVKAIKAPHTTFLSAPFMNNVQKLITSYTTAVRNQDVPPEAVTSQHAIMKILVEHWRRRGRSPGRARLGWEKAEKKSFM